MGNCLVGIVTVLVGSFTSGDIIVLVWSCPGVELSWREEILEGICPSRESSWWRVVPVWNCPGGSSP